MSGDFPPAWAERQLTELAPGTLIGHYRIESRIGVGGMAAVFRAQEESLGRPVALKVLQPALTADTEFRERFIRESRVASAVDHPNIIPVHAAGEDRGVLYLAMRYVAGGDLHSVVEREGPLPPDRVLSLLNPVASALDAAHGAGIVHRDVKPANILIDHHPGRPDHPYLSDFGLAKRSVAPGLTNAGEFVGTAGFASPEQLSGRPVTPRTDQYALACVAFTVLTASMPFRHGDPEAALWAQMSSPPPRVTDRRLDLSPEVDQVIARALARDPAERYASCGDFAGALHQALVLPPGNGARPGAGGTQGLAAGGPPRQSRAPQTQAQAPGQQRWPTQQPPYPPRPMPPQASPGQEPPGQYRRARRDGHRRTIALWAGAGGAVVVAAVVVAALLLNGGNGGNSRGASGPETTAPAAPKPSSNGDVSLAGTLETGAATGAATVGFGPDGTLRVLSRAGSVTTFTLSSRRGVAGTPLRGGAGTDAAATRFSLDGSMIVRPASTCAAGPCTYGVSDAGTGVGAWTIKGGAGPVLSAGNDTVADADAQGDGVDVWNLSTQRPVARGMADPDRGPVRAAALDPTGQAVAVSSESSGVNHHVYWEVLSTRQVVATERVPRMMAIPWTRPGGVTGLPLGLTGQTLAASGGSTTRIIRALPDQPTRAQTFTVPGGMLAISPHNGNLIATLDQSSPDGVVLWSAATGTQVASLTLPGRPSAVAFSPDGGSAAVSCSNGDIYVWTITSSAK